MKRIALLFSMLAITLLSSAALADGGAASTSAKPLVTLVDNDLHAVNMDSWPDAPPNQTLQMQIRFKDRNEDLQRRFIEDQQNLGSPDYHRALTHQEIMTNFAVFKVDFDAVAEWLTDQGFEIIEPHWDEISYIKFAGTVDQTNRAFHTRIVTSPNGKDGDTVDPSIPGRFSEIIASVLGLEAFSNVQGDAFRKQEPSIKPHKPAPAASLHTLYKTVASNSDFQIGTNSVGFGAMKVATGAYGFSRLNNGTVLVAGGTNGTNNIASAEVYDPMSGSFTLLTSSLSRARNSPFDFAIK